MTERVRRGRPANGERRTNVPPALPGFAERRAPDWAPEMGYVSLDPPTIRVILSFRKAFGDESSEQEIEWPAAWRLPLQGERIHLSATFGGIVSTLDFDVERGLIVIHLR